MTNEKINEKGIVVSLLPFIQNDLDDWCDEENDTSVEDDSYTQEAKDFAIGKFKSFVDDLKENFEGSIGEKILLNTEGEEDFHELNERANTIDFPIGAFEETRIYILLTKEIPAFELDKILLNTWDFGFNAMFPNDGELIGQNYDYGEYDTGYFADWCDEENYIIGYFKEGGSVIPNDERPYYEGSIKAYNIAMEMFKE